MNILDQILDVKRQEVQQIQNMDLGEIYGQIRSLKDALSKPGISIISEIKMKSPSEGVIIPNADPLQIAKDYEAAGAAAISVLTDQPFFGGSLDILKAVREAVSIPVIRKDFIIDEKQIAETVHYHADAFLLIADALDQDGLQQLMTNCFFINSSIYPNDKLLIYNVGIPSKALSAAIVAPSEITNLELFKTL